MSEDRLSVSGLEPLDSACGEFPAFIFNEGTCLFTPFSVNKQTTASL